jgi:hypothetical protein
MYDPEDCLEICDNLMCLNLQTDLTMASASQLRQNTIDGGKRVWIHSDLSRKLLVQAGEESTGLFYPTLPPIPRGDHILSPLI